MKKWRLTWEFWRTVPHLEGEIYNDEKGVLKDGARCFTGTVIKISADGHTAYTHGRSFTLHPPCYAGLVPPPRPVTVKKQNVTVVQNH